ncbi:hypothetical protein SNEBB_002411 [Seison nebaliae]|nr:hypothetical protein SNEBB_002411 [Seison nebaliae]
MNSTSELPTGTTTTTTTNEVPTLVLRGNCPENEETGRSVRWKEDTVDNEHQNKKKSKCCCVYIKPRDRQVPPKENENENHDCGACHHHTPSDYQQKKEEN